MVSIVRKQNMLLNLGLYSLHIHMWVTLSVFLHDINITLSALSPSEAFYCSQLNLKLLWQGVNSAFCEQWRLLLHHNARCTNVPHCPRPASTNKCMMIEEKKNHCSFWKLWGVKGKSYIVDSGVKVKAVFLKIRTSMLQMHTWEFRETKSISLVSLSSRHILKTAPSNWSFPFLTDFHPFRTISHCRCWWM